MGLNATVGCNCYRDGKTKPCSFPEYIEMKEDGYWDLYLPDEEEKNEEEALKKFTEFHEWRRTACKHDDMDIIFKRVGSGYGLKRFNDILKKVGNERFKTIIRELSKGYGTTPPELAKKIQKELLYFKSLTILDKVAYLVSKKTGNYLCEYIEGESGIYHKGKKIIYKVDFNGFHIIDAFSTKDVFNSKQFKQIKHFGRVRFVDIPSGKIWKGRRSIIEPGDLYLKLRLPCSTSEFHVEVRDRNPDDFKYIIKVLLRLCDASCKTGNPIRWS